MIIPIQQTKQHFIVAATTTQSTVQINIVLPNYNNIEIYVNDNILSNSLYNINNSGLITFTPAIVGYAEVIIISNLPYSKPFDFSNASEWNSQEVNKQLTDPIIQIQQLFDLIPFKSRPEEYITYIIPRLAERKNKFMIFDENGALSISDADFDKLPEYVELAKKWATSLNEVEQSLYGAKKYAIDSANKATDAYNSATVAANKATDAATSATNASNSATNAATSATNSATSATNSANSATLAENWAISETEVQPSKYSAKYWANQASLIAIPNNSITDDKIFDNANIKRKKLNKAFYDGFFGDYTFILLEDIYNIFTSGVFPISEKNYDIAFMSSYFNTSVPGLYRITICFNITQIPNTPSVGRGIYVTFGANNYIIADLSRNYTQNYFGCSYTGYFSIPNGFTLSYQKGSDSYEPFHISEFRINVELITETPY